MSCPEDAARTYDRACIAFRGWATFTNYPIACYRGDPLLRRYVRMEADAAPTAAAGDEGAVPSILLPHVTPEDFVAALHQPAASSACADGAAAGSGSVGKATPPTRAVPAPAPAVTVSPQSAAEPPAPQGFRGVSFRQGRFIAQIGCGTNSAKNRVMCACA